MNSNNFRFILRHRLICINPKIDFSVSVCSVEIKEFIRVDPNRKKKLETVLITK